MQLIKITEQNGKKAVSARELHSFLESKKDFSTWIKQRISKYGFTEGHDFVTFTQKGERAVRIEYALTIDTAKEIAMVEGNAKGKQARQYFIECERKASASNATLPVPATQIEVLLQSVQLLAAQERRVSEIETRVDLIEAKAKTQPDDYYAIAGYAATIKKPIDVTMASAIGKKASAICNRLGYVMGTIPDPRFGRVKTYPKQVLAEVFNNHFSN